MNTLHLKGNIFTFSLRDTLRTIFVFACAFGLCFLLQNISENDSHVPLIFILVVMLVSRFTNGYFYGLLSVLLSFVAVNYIFTYPYFELNFSLTGYPLTFLTMLLVSLVTTTLTTQIKMQEIYIKENEKEKIRANLLRGISHDIRTPLTGIVGATNALLESDDIAPEKQRELLRDVNDDAQWLIRMVENVLTITKVSDASYSLPEESEIVEEIVSAAVLQFRKARPDIEVRVDVPEEVLFVPMDATLIQQVMLNIMHNSAIHGKTCTQIDIRITKADGFAVFTFTDNGCGFSWKDQSKDAGLAWPSMATDRPDKQRNMGIGLSVCRTIISAHNGDFRIWNPEEGGAAVEFRLPLEEE